MYAPTPFNKAIVSRRLRLRGFTLIELLVAIAIIGILASIALPQYYKHTQSTRRADAQVALNLEIQSLERCRVTLASYVGCNLTSSESPDKHYELQLQGVTRSNYTLVARAQGVQASDTECAFMAIDAEGVRSASTTVGKCWSN